MIPIKDDLLPFTFGLDEDKKTVWFLEDCDQFIWSRLSREDMGKLISYMQVMYDVMLPGGVSIETRSGGIYDQPRLVEELTRMSRRGVTLQQTRL